MATTRRWRGNVMLMVAPNGARRTTADHPALPVTPGALAETAEACAQAGAAAIHLHVRDEAQRHSLDAGRYRAAMAAIAARVGQRILVQVTTEAAGMYDRTAQMQVVRDLVPPAVSLALRELVPDDAEETLETAASFFRWLGEAGVAPQYILYSPADVVRFGRLKAAGVIPQGRPFLLFVLGRYGADPGEPAQLGAFLEARRGLSCAWMACAFGPREAQVALTAVEAGGHVRIGFENNLQLPDGRPARDNAELVTATRALLEAAGHAVMDVDAARDLLAETARI